MTTETISTQVAPVTEHDTPLTPLRVLCVDDNHDAADSLGFLLGMTGYEVEVAHDAASALDVAERVHPQAYVLDITMPGMDGNELARRLRERPGGDDVLLIALTALGDYRSLEQMAAAGFDAHFTKPTRLEELCAALRDFARNGRPGR